MNIYSILILIFSFCFVSLSQAMDKTSERINVQTQIDTLKQEIATLKDQWSTQHTVWQQQSSKLSTMNSAAPEYQPCIDTLNKAAREKAALLDKRLALETQVQKLKNQLSTDQNSPKTDIIQTLQQKKKEEEKSPKLLAILGLKRTNSKHKIND